MKATSWRDGWRDSSFAAGPSGRSYSSIPRSNSNRSEESAVMAGASEGRLPKSNERQKVWRAVPSAPRTFQKAQNFTVFTNTSGALGTYSRKSIIFPQIFRASAANCPHNRNERSRDRGRGRERGGGGLLCPLVPVVPAWGPAFARTLRQG